MWWENGWFQRPCSSLISASQVVPKGKARIRVQVSAAHSEEDIDRAVTAFIEVGKLKGVI